MSYPLLGLLTASEMYRLEYENLAEMENKEARSLGLKKRLQEGTAPKISFLGWGE